MDLKIKIPHKKNHIRFFIYNIPPWLVVWIVLFLMLLRLMTGHWL
ncbi:hypothetical protein [Chitinophaga sp. GbtcB8]|nr:hypothetical protein [Chitinophaga sp. GbtcB8]